MRKGHKHTEEARRKIGLAQKGISKIHSKEARRKMSLAHKGMKKPWAINNFKKFREKGIAPNKGRKFSKEWKENMSLANKGKHHSTSTEFKKGCISLRKGKKLSKETKRKIGETLKKRKIAPITRFENLSEETIEKIRRARARQILPIKDSSIEVKIQNYLKQLKIDFFTHQYIKNIEHGYQCDIWIPSMELIIECDGDYWHKYPEGRNIDKIRTKELIEKGFKVLRLWEREIRVMNIDDFKERLSK